LRHVNGGNKQIVCKDSNKIIYDGPTAIDIAWLLPLNAGSHEAKLIIHSKDKFQQLEYSWQFEIIAGK